MHISLVTQQCMHINAHKLACCIGLLAVFQQAMSIACHDAARLHAAADGQMLPLLHCMHVDLT